MNYTTDPVFQAVQNIFTPAEIEPVLSQSWEHWLGHKPQFISVVPALTYYRPFNLARIVAEVTVTVEDDAEPTRLNIFFNVLADSDKMRQQLEQGYELAVPPNVALPVFAIADWQTLVWTLPHAPCLPELIPLLQPDYFCPLLIAPEDLPADPQDYPLPQLFRYVPFKRAILTWDSPCTHQRYFIKLCKELEFTSVVENFQQIYNLSKYLSFRVPEPIAADAASSLHYSRGV
ncbi:hypothetical protein [Altericista sp. CCNU0014]|uniref:hypothetical protein n=1 Tax=Altericista sp. CCNU0014 TaxID=3082949 RepID=UPI00384ECDEA